MHLEGGTLGRSWGAGCKEAGNVLGGLGVLGGELARVLTSVEPDLVAASRHSEGAVESLS